jgi:hypothetical protein
LQTSLGQAWQPNPAASGWLTAVGDFTGTLEDIGKYILAPEFSSLPTFQVIQQFRSLQNFDVPVTFPGSFRFGISPSSTNSVIQVLTSFVHLRQKHEIPISF